KPDQRLRQHHLAQIPGCDAHVGSLYRHTEGEREVQEVPVIRILFAVGKAQGSIFAAPGVEHARVMEAKDHPDQQPGAEDGETGEGVMQR
nr:hypothetical protein [Tanacetum cinerariifolium]